MGDALKLGAAAGAGAVAAGLLYSLAGSDEAAFVTRFQAHQLEAVAVTSVGLSTLCRPLLVLQTPGVVEDYAADPDGTLARCTFMTKRL